MAETYILSRGGDWDAERARLLVLLREARVDTAALVAHGGAGVVLLARIDAALAAQPQEETGE